MTYIQTIIINIPKNQELRDKKRMGSYRPEEKLYYVIIFRKIAIYYSKTYF